MGSNGLRNTLRGNRSSPLSTKRQLSDDRRFEEPVLAVPAEDELVAAPVEPVLPQDGSAAWAAAAELAFAAWAFLVAVDALQAVAVPGALALPVEQGGFETAVLVAAAVLAAAAAVQAASGSALPEAGSA